MEMLTIINLTVLGYALHVLKKNEEYNIRTRELAMKISEQADQLIGINNQIAYELTKARECYESTLTNGNPHQ